MPACLRIPGQQDDVELLLTTLIDEQSPLGNSRNDLDEADRFLDLALLDYQDAGVEVLPPQLYSGRANLAMARGELVEADIELGKALNAFRQIDNRRRHLIKLNKTNNRKYTCSDI